MVVDKSSKFSVVVSDWVVVGANVELTKKLVVLLSLEVLGSVVVRKWSVNSVDVLVLIVVVYSVLAMVDISGSVAGFVLSKERVSTIGSAVVTKLVRKSDVVVVSIKLVVWVSTEGVESVVVVKTF